MDSDTVTASTALATSLIAAPLELSESREQATGGLARARQPARSPAELLASLLDFPGSVALAELLEGGPRSLPPDSARAPKGALRPGERTLPSQALAERLMLDAEARLDSLETVVLKPLTGRRAPGIPSPAELLDQLTRDGVIGAPEGEPASKTRELNAQRFAESLGLPFRSALGLCLRQAQAHVATLRWEITHDLRALGPRADELERLDAALGRSMQAKLGELLDRMEHAAHLTFVRACLHAIEALPEQVDEAALASWCDENGWLVRYRERCVRMAKALFGHLRRNLEGLMRAAASDHDDWMGDP